MSLPFMFAASAAGIIDAKVDRTSAVFTEFWITDAAILEPAEYPA